ncbi:MAG: ABC transporter ATP-binding protein [Candidatus Theseobacter exili]|nr:ABC transporter ATP-binding protein [Candidatus Theseobacter exili]
MGPLLKVENLKTVFMSERGKVKAVDGISFEIEKGQTLALVGESGCGKSVTCLSILRLLMSSGRIEKGKILFQGKNILSLCNRELRQVRGGQIGMVFQEPMTSLNPLMTLGQQIREILLCHNKISKKEADTRVVELLRDVRFPKPDKSINLYPHQISGGMRQRVMIAIAVACKPLLLIADEPTTALDVTIQAEILDLIQYLKESYGMAVLFVTHNLGIVRQTADKVVVMYAGKAVEEANTDDLFEKAIHPYTRHLIESVPDLHRNYGDFLPSIPGKVPDALHRPEGCPFCLRCDEEEPVCRELMPDFYEYKTDHRVACWGAIHGK